MDEKFADFACKRCGKCCRKHGTVRLNDKEMEYSKIPKSDVTDRLALAALYYSMISLATEHSSQLGDADIEELHAIEERIRRYIKA